MSETTSTNISVVQADSTDSIPVSSTRYSRMTDPSFTKRICFYKSGDPRFNGIKMVVSNRSFKTFDALLDSLSKKVPLPFGVRNITTPRGIHHITTLEELADGKSYICSHQRKIKPINLERASKKPLLWQSSRPISARRRVRQLTRQNEVAPFQKENTVVLGSSKNFVIFKNGDKECKHSLVLNKKYIQNFDVFLDQISDVMQFPVYKLYSTDGRRILSTHALLLSSGTIVAAGREPFKPGNYESEREFLPAKLPGISHRVFPKSRSKQEMKSLKANESLFTSPNHQEHIHESSNVCTTDDNFVDFSHIPDNELHLTQQWPQSGEELPVISPGDNIEKTVHLNSDGTMTVEMKVCFKITEDETINWSTTVSRAELSHNMNPEVRAISATTSPIRVSSINCKSSDEGIKRMEIKQHSHIEKLTNQLQDNDINTNKCRTSSTRTEKSTFYRPPTPGIRKGQERKLSVRRASEDTLQETMTQISISHEIENRTTAHGNESEDKCSKQELELTVNADSESREASLKQNEIDQSNEENFGALETNHMELLHKNTMYEKGVRKCEKSNYMAFTGTSKIDRPHLAGKQKFYQEQFKFKEIKRSMSTSIAVSEQSKLQEEIKHTNIEFRHGQCLDMITRENEVEHIVDVPNERFSKDVLSTIDYKSTISREKAEKSSENDTGISNNNHSTTSSLGPKKKNRKNLNNPRKHLQTNIQKYDAACVDSPQVEQGISCGEASITAKNIMFENIFSSHIHPCPNESELSTPRKLKGNKQMAKVKPRSLKTNNEVIHNSNQNTEDGEDKKCNVVELISRKNTADYYSNTMTSNETVIYDNPEKLCSLAESKPVPEEIMPKNNTRSKRSNKTSKKQKSPKKKKSSIPIESKTTNGSDSLVSETNNSSTLQNALESYVQSWLKNIFPNLAFPVLQPRLSTKLEDDITNAISFNKGSCTPPYVEIKHPVKGEICGNANGFQCHNKPGCEGDHIEYTGLSSEKEIPVQQVQPFDEDVSSLMEKSKHLVELFAQQFNDFGCHAFPEGSKSEEVTMDMTGYEPLKKASIDAAVQVENNNSQYIKCGFMEEMLAEQFGMSPKNISMPKTRRLEKSFSLPNSPSRPESSSSLILLAWLIVLHIKQNMSHSVENVPNESNNSSAIFTLLQSLKKIAVTEKADDLKTIVLHLQESAMRSLTSVPCVREPTPIHKFPLIQPNSTESTTEYIIENNHNLLSIKETWETSDALKSEVLIDDIDDFRFFATQPYRELSSEYSQNENDKRLEEHSLSEYQHTLQNTASFLERVEQIPNDKHKFEEHQFDLSPSYLPSLMSNYNVHHTVPTNPVSSPNISRVKLMVQEMEQRRYSSQNCEQKCLQSPISSDWSDYRQESEESDNVRASSELMTESGEDQIHEKPFKTGRVKRAIERLYGKADSKIHPSKITTKISSCNNSQCNTCPNNENNEYLTFSSQEQQCASKETISRSISSPSNKSTKESKSSSLKSVFLPLLDAAAEDDGLICQKPGSSQSNKSRKHKDSHVESCSHRHMSTNNGILIDKGRWLLKENHLLRRSPPEATGMYGNLDTTSGDTLLDNTSDEVPYMHSACKVSQPMAEMSSSEIEDMAKPLHYTCNYFNMPHGSDSEPFCDTLSTRSKVRPKSSGALVKSKTHDSVSLESLEKCSGISASLPSFATVDFHVSNNKVHPLPYSDVEKTRKNQSPDTASVSRGQIKEQDSLDKLHVICGQHCPILSAIILPVDEGNRGFAYCSRNDIENLLWSTNTLDTALLNNCAIRDENNNIQYKMKGPVNNCCATENMLFDDDDHHEDFKRLNTFINLKKRTDCLSELYPNIATSIARIINLYKDIHTSKLFQDLTCMRNDENNNILHFYT